jgi:DUF5010 C-terminal domain
MYAQQQDVDATSWAVGYTAVGEWLQYTRHFSGGRYDVWLNAATPTGSSAALQLELRTINTGAAAPGTGKAKNTRGLAAFSTTLNYTAVDLLAILYCCVTHALVLACF